LTRSQWTAAESNGFPVFARAHLTRISTGGEPARPWRAAGGENRRAIIERGGVNDLFLVAARRIGRKVAMAAGKP
jgi:hypothetical protein